MPTPYNIWTFQAGHFRCVDGPFYDLARAERQARTLARQEGGRYSVIEQGNQVKLFALVRSITHTPPPEHGPAYLFAPKTIHFDSEQLKPEQILRLWPNPTHGWFELAVRKETGIHKYTVAPTEMSYPDIVALHLWRTTVWVEEDAERIKFLCHTPDGLRVLEEELEQGHYRFSSLLGGIDLNVVTVYKNQGEDIDAFDRENTLDFLIDAHKTPEPESEEEHD